MRWKLVTIVFILVAIVAGGYFLFSRETVPSVTIGPDDPVVAFGDSLTAGYGATYGHDYVSILSQKIEHTVINAGKNGDTTTSAIARFNSDVLSKKPAIVIVFLGGNDVLQGLSTDQTLENLETLLDNIQRINAVPVLVGLGSRAGFEDKTKALADREKIPYVPAALDGILGHPELLSDPIHPNDDGYALIADRIYEVIKGYFNHGQ